MELAVLQRPPPTFSSVFSIGPCSEALFESFTCKQLRKLQQDAGNSELRHLVDSYLRRYPIRQADVAAGQHVALLRHHASVPGARLELPPATYALVRRDERNAAHLLNEPRPEHPRERQGYRAWEAGLAEKPEGYDEARAAHDAGQPQWRLGCGPLELAAGVTIVGQEGVELTHDDCTGLQGAEGACFVSVHFPQGVAMRQGLMSMEKCTSTGQMIHMKSGARLIMEDCRVFGSVAGACSWNTRLRASWRLRAALSRTTNGTACPSSEGRPSWWTACCATTGSAACTATGGAACARTAAAVGGAISGNALHGMAAYDHRSKVTVAAAEHSETVDRPQTVSSGNGGHDWATQGGRLWTAGPDHGARGGHPGRRTVRTRAPPVEHQ